MGDFLWTGGPSRAGKPACGPVRLPYRARARQQPAEQAALSLDMQGMNIACGAAAEILQGV